MDKVVIKGLEIYAYHGLYSEEKRLGQKFAIDCFASLNLSSAQVCDTIDRTVNYGELSDFIVSYFTTHTFDLIETSAEKLTYAILDRYTDILELTIRVHKPQAPVGYHFDTVYVEFTRGWKKAFIGIGSNVGDKKGYIESAENELSQAIRLINSSSIITTEPWGNIEQEVFLNKVIEVETYLPAKDLLLHLQSIENKLGRVRTQKWGPRTIDLDILFYSDDIIYEKDLIVPHPFVASRKFVLDSMNEIAPFFVHPVKNSTIYELLQTHEAN